MCERRKLSGSESFLKRKQLILSFHTASGEMDVHGSYTQVVVIRGKLCQCLSNHASLPDNQL